jgi:hypothetical protein
VAARVQEDHMVGKRHLLDRDADEDAHGAIVGKGMANGRTGLLWMNWGHDGLWSLDAIKGHGALCKRDPLRIDCRNQGDASAAVLIVKDTPQTVRIGYQKKGGHRHHVRGSDAISTTPLPGLCSCLKVPISSGISNVTKVLYTFGSSMRYPTHSQESRAWTEKPAIRKLPGQGLVTSVLPTIHPQTD